MSAYEGWNAFIGHSRPDHDISVQDHDNECDCGGEFDEDDKCDSCSNGHDDCEAQECFACFERAVDRAERMAEGDER